MASLYDTSATKALNEDGYINKLYDSTMERRRIGFYNEEEAKASGILYPEGYKLIDTLFEK